MPVQNDANHPVFGFSHRDILYSGKNNKGLILYNTRQKEGMLISEEAGSGSDIVVLDNEIRFRVPTGDNSQSRYEYKKYNPDTKRISDYIPEEPEGMDVHVDGKLLHILKDGERIKTVAPIGDFYYIWASLSPDQKNILFTAASKGTYVADIEGEVLYELGSLHASKWMNNDWVIGMNDSDDGHVITASEIVAVHIRSGKRSNISGDSEKIALYPDASKDAKRVVFQNDKGELFVAKIRIRNHR